MLHSAARSPVPCCKISTATLPIFSWDHLVNSACDLGGGSSEISDLRHAVHEPSSLPSECQLADCLQARIP